MLEPIGKEVTQRYEKRAIVEEEATHFSVNDFRVRPHSHEVRAEVCLMDADGNAVGPARWVQLNPDPQGADNWNAMADMTLREINAKVKAILQTWEMTGG